MPARHLALWLSLISLPAFFWPRLPFEADPFVASRPLLWSFIALIMFAVGTLLPRDELRQVAHRWPSVLAGTAVQYLTMPLAALTCAHLFRLDPIASAGLVVVGCVPGAMASNVLTLAARGNVSYSVSLTASATLLSPLVVPAALFLVLAATTRLSPLEVSWKLLSEVVIPVTAGHLLAGRFPSFAGWASRWSPVISKLCILWVIAVVVALNRETLLQMEPALLGALLTVNLLGYLAGYGGGVLLRLPETMRRALTLEVGMQNAGLGTVLALSLFPEQPAVAVAPAAYTFGCMFTGTLLAQRWSRRPAHPPKPSGAAACVDGGLRGAAPGLRPPGDPPAAPCGSGPTG